MPENPARPPTPGIRGIGRLILAALLAVGVFALARGAVWITIRLLDRFRRLAESILPGIDGLLTSIELPLDPGALLAQLTPQPWLLALVQLTVMMACILILIQIFSQGNFPSYGFRRSESAGLRWSLLGFLGGLLLGLLHIGMQIVLPGGGIPPEALHTIHMHSLFLWIYGAVAQELLFRGLIQSYLSPLGTRGVSLGRLRLSLPVLAAAVLFGGVQLQLLATPLPRHILLSVFLTTVLVGLLAGLARERTRSLLPAIFVHAGGNGAVFLVILFMAFRA